MKDSEDHRPVGVCDPGLFLDALAICLGQEELQEVSEALLRQPFCTAPCMGGEVHYEGRGIVCRDWAVTMRLLLAKRAMDKTKAILDAHNSRYACPGVF
jgi:hypothetical protein